MIVVPSCPTLPLTLLPSFSPSPLQRGVLQPDYLTLLIKFHEECLDPLLLWPGKVTQPGGRDQRAGNQAHVRDSLCSPY